MTTAAKITFGAKVFMDPAPTAAATMVAELLSVDPPNEARGTQDATTHDSPAGAEEVIGEGTYDPGDLKFQVHYIAGSPGDLAFVTALTGGAKQNLKLHSKSATGYQAMSTQAYVTGYGPDGMAVKGKQTATVTAKCTGAKTYAAVP